MTDRKKLPERTRQELAGWAERSGCRLLVLFGSAADGAGAQAGDVDLAVVFPKLPDAERRLALIGEIQDVCDSRTADVVFLHPDTDPVLRFEIFRGGVPIYERSAGLFNDEVVRALALFEDALPFRRALGRSLARSREGA